MEEGYTGKGATWGRATWKRATRCPKGGSEVNASQSMSTPKVCDAPKPGCPLTTRQPAEFYVSHVMKHTHE